MAPYAFKLRRTEGLGEYQMRRGAEAATATLGRMSDPLNHVDYRLARTAKEKEEIYNLRYRAYLREGAVRPSVDQRVTDQYDDMPNSWTFGVYFQSELYSSIRISVLTPKWRLSTATEVFGEIVLPRLDRGEIIVDPTRFVAEPDKAKRFPELPYVTVRLAHLACEYFNAATGFALVRPEHQPFYRRVFLHEPIAEPRLVPGLIKPVALMAVDCLSIREKVLERFPMMRSSAFERRMLFERDGGPWSSTPEASVSRFEPVSIVPQQA